MVLLGIIIPFLVFFISLNTVYAYFTASSTLSGKTTKTATVELSFKADGASTIVATTESGTAKIIPGDTLTIGGKVFNVGSADAYAVLVYTLKIKKTSSSYAETIAKKYLTFDTNSNLVEITGTTGNYNCLASQIVVNNFKTLSGKLLQYKFNAAEFDNTYQNAKIFYEISAYGIQCANLTQDQATEMLMESCGYYDYKIVGKSVQNGTPTPTSPVEIQSVGERINCVDLSKTNVSNSTTHTTFSYDNKTSTLELTSTPSQYDYANLYLKDLGIDLEIGKTYYFGTKVIVSGKSTNGATVTSCGIKTSTKSALMQTITRNSLQEVRDSFVYNGEEDARLIFNFNYGSTEPAQVKFENIYFSEINQYEPYGYKVSVDNADGSSSYVYLDEPLRKVGNVADYIDLEKGVVVRNVKYLNLSTLSVDKWSKYVSVENHFQVSVGDNYFNLKENYVLSNYYSPNKRTGSYSSSQDYAIMSVDGSRIRFKNKDCSTLDEWLTHLSNLDEPIYVVKQIVVP